MTTTIADLESEVVTRIAVQVSVGLDASTLAIADFLRYGFRELFSKFPQVKQTDTTIDADYTSSVPGMTRLYYCQKAPIILFDGIEYGQARDTIVFVEHAVEVGDLVEVWYGLDQSIVTVPNTNAETTELDCDYCFGADWLVPAALTYAERQVHWRLGQAGNSEHLSSYRVLEDTYKEQIKELRTTYEAWRGEMERRLQRRQQFGPYPVVENPYQGFKNESRRINRLTNRP